MAEALSLEGPIGSCSVTDYFELKTMKTQQIQEKSFTSPSSTAKICIGKGAYTRKRIIRNTFLLTKLICITGQPLFSRHLLCLPVNGLLFFVSPDPTPFLISSGCYISFNHLAAFWVSYFYGNPMCMKLHLFFSC